MKMTTPSEHEAEKRQALSRNDLALFGSEQLAKVETAFFTCWISVAIHGSSLSSVYVSVVSVSLLAIFFGRIVTCDQEFNETNHLLLGVTSERSSQP